MSQVAAEIVRLAILEDMAPETANLPEQHPDLRRLFFLRGLIFTTATLAVIAVGWWLGVPPDWQVLAGLLIVCLIINGVTHRTLSRPQNRLYFSTQLLTDLLVLAILLWITGGATNPLVWLLLLQPTIAAITLPRRHVWAITLSACIFYTLLLYFHQPIPDLRMLTGSAFSLHIIGMWCGFIVSVILIAHFVSGMAADVRARDHELAQAREHALRDEKLVSLGALAANAAHDLGTPLGTLAVLTEELQADMNSGDTAAALDNLTEMDAQLVRCKQVVQSIATSAGIPSAQGGQAMAVSTFMHQTIDQWSQRRKDAHLTRNIEPGPTNPRIVADSNLASALCNLFDNAADASAGDVCIRAGWDDRQLAVHVHDRGPGFPPSQQARVGKEPFTGKVDGHGLGLYLSHGIIERHGGQLSIQPRDGGGTVVSVQLPLAGLKA